MSCCRVENLNVADSSKVVVLLCAMNAYGGSGLEELLALLISVLCGCRYSNDNFFNRLSHSQFIRREVNGQTGLIKLICFLEFPANAPKTEQA